jgi:hypothetical protein
MFLLTKQCLSTETRIPSGKNCSDDVLFPQVEENYSPDYGFELDIKVESVIVNIVLVIRNLVT